MSDSYKCSECGLHYRDKAMAKTCEEFCQRNQACSIDITKHAIENEVQA